MPRPILLLLLLAACAPAESLRAPAPTQQGAAELACRDEAERVMRFRERGQTMRTDEAQASLGTSGHLGTQARIDSFGGIITRDRLIAECLRGAAPPPGPGS
jgi:hypothetical protein